MDTFDSVKYRYDEIAHPLAELKKYVSNEPSEIASENAAIVFTTALQCHFDKLRDIAREIALYSGLQPAALFHSGAKILSKLAESERPADRDAV